MTYNEARDAYSQLAKWQRIRVLDLVSTFTDAQIGEEAEAAFVKAVQQVQAKAVPLMYRGFP